MLFHRMDQGRLCSWLCRLAKPNIRFIDSNIGNIGGTVLARFDKPLFELILKNFIMKTP